MKRRDFLKQASMAALATGVVPLGAAGKRIAFGGIQIECSTYGNILSRMEDFTVRRGQALADYRLFAVTKGYPHPFMPVFLASAVPGGRVERATYDALKTEFLGRLRELMPLDGVYLPMHGAMYVDGMTDAEGDWISAVRAVVGERCLISASYDLHGNLSRRVIDNLDMLSAFRTAPHIDREDTHKRACDMLVRCLDEGIRPTLVWAPIPVLMPGERSSTEYEPAKRLWGQLPALNAQDGVMDVSLLVGYVWADEARATAAAVLTGTTPAALHKTATQLAQQYWDAPHGVHLRRADRHDGRGDRESAGAPLAARCALGLGRQPDRRRHGRPRRRARRAAADEGPRRGARGHRRSAGNRGVLPGRGRADAHAENRREPGSSGQHARGGRGQGGVPGPDRQASRTPGGDRGRRRHAWS